jgi:hypothetical protein
VILFLFSFHFNAWFFPISHAEPSPAFAVQNVDGGRFREHWVPVRVDRRPPGQSSTHVATPWLLAAKAKNAVLQKEASLDFAAEMMNVAIRPLHSESTKFKWERPRSWLSPARQAPEKVENREARQNWQHAGLHLRPGALVEATH